MRIMRIAIGVPENLESSQWNGFITAFRDINNALEDHERIVFAPQGGDIRLEGSACSADCRPLYSRSITRPVFSGL